MKKASNFFQINRAGLQKEGNKVWIHLAHICVYYPLRRRKHRVYPLSRATTFYKKKLNRKNCLIVSILRVDLVP